MKCPYCGHESKERHCEYCHAMIPDEMPKQENKEEPNTNRRKRKEMRTDGT